MDLLIAERLVLYHMNAHQLIQQGWTFEWARPHKFYYDKDHNKLSGRLPGWKSAAHVLGLCYLNAKKIKLVKRYVAASDRLLVLDMLFHEIAHALTPNDSGHGPEWQTMAIKLGANPSSTQIAPDYNPQPVRRENERLFFLDCQKCEYDCPRILLRAPTTPYPCIYCGEPMRVKDFGVYPKP